jgi:glycosyltransferase involved in cell wall biosynthesis
MWVEGFQDANSVSVPSDIVRYPEPEKPEDSEDSLPQRSESVEEPLVSVIVPVLDEEEYILDALEGVGSQTHGGVEVVLVDSSNSARIKKLSQRSEWIRRFKQEPQGVSAARNLGIGKAKGDYIALLDADDYWHPEKIERQVATVEKESADAVWTDSYRIDLRGDKAEVNYRAKIPPEDGSGAHLDVLRNGYAISTSSLLLRSSEIPEKPFNEDLEAHEDAVFAVEFFKDRTVARVPEPLTVRRVREGSLTSDPERMYRGRIQGLEYIAEEHPELKGEASGKISRKQYNRARSLLASGRRYEARRNGYMSLRSDATNYRSALLCLASYLPVGSEAVVSTFELGRSVASKLFSQGGTSVERKEVTVCDTGDWRDD